MVTLRAMSLADADFVLSVRNDELTRSFLHNNTVYDKEDFTEWFETTSPEWYIILNSDTPVGYIRISDINLTNKSLYVGADIHPQHRREGHAVSGYLELFKILANRNFQYADLAVLETNHPARHLYNKLGFKEIERKNVSEKPSIIMRKELSLH